MTFLFPHQEGATRKMSPGKLPPEVLARACPASANLCLVNVAAAAAAAADDDDDDYDGDDDDDDDDDDGRWCVVGFPVTQAPPQGFRAPGHFPEHQTHSSIEIYLKIYFY